jgi:hypothetical protein
VLTLASASFAHAQYQLYVKSPANIKGIVRGTSDPSATGWGLGDPQDVTPRVCGFATYATPDSIVRDTNVRLNTVAGKIAVIYRGTSEFGTKAYVAQRSGAIGVIIVNRTNGPSGMGAGANGALVTIPVIMASFGWERSVRSLIANGTLELCIGNPLGEYTTNLTMLPALCAYPSPVHIPSFLVREPGDMNFKVGARMINAGSLSQQNVSLVSTVSRVSDGRILLRDSSFHPFVGATNTPGDTAGRAFAANFDLVSALPNQPNQDYSGHYRVTYRIVTPNIDSLPDDNTLSTDFYVGAADESPTSTGLRRGNYSRTRLNLTPGAKFVPISTTGTTRSITAGDGSFKMGQYIRMRNRDVLVDSLTFATSTFTVTLAGLTINLEVNEWNDVNNDGVITDAELTLVGTGVRDYTSDAEKAVFVTEALSDATTGLTGVTLQANKRYLIVWSYEGGDQVTISCDEDQNFNQYATLDSIGDYAGVLNVNGWAYGFIGLDNTAAFRIHMQETVVANKPTTNLINFSVYPNPAQDIVQISVGDAAGTGSATIQIRDLAGRLVSEETHLLEGSRSVYRVSTATLNPGIYNVSVSTGRGTKSKKLAITR